MTRKMIINALDPEEIRIAILNGPRLEDFDIETKAAEKSKGNIYKGVVMAVEPALNAAFVNYGSEKQGFLTAHDVHPKYTAEGVILDKHPNITQLLQPKQTILVQITKDEVGSKGAVLTTYLSLAGRYLVLMPDSDTQGISRKINDEQTRRKVREAASKLDMPADMGVIIRTAGWDRTKQDLNRDLKILLRLWQSIQKESQNKKAPALIFKEQDMIIRALRDYFSSDIDEIILDDDEAYDRASEYIHLVMPNHKSVLTRHVESRPIFNHYKIEQQLEQIYKRKVTLPSGGSIAIDSTEALVAVDVNSGKQKEQNQEATALQTNLEAAQEVARQLRLRDLGGIIVIDFIDMMFNKNKQRVRDALEIALQSDKARTQVDEISPHGTLEITRQRLRSSLQSSVFDRCSNCDGTGHVINASSHAIGILRKLRDRASRGDLKTARIKSATETINTLKTRHWQSLQEIEKRYGIKLDIQSEPSFKPGQDDFTFETDPQAKVLPVPEPNFGPAPIPEGYQEQLAQEERALMEDGDDEILFPSEDMKDTANYPDPEENSPKQKQRYSKANKRRSPVRDNNNRHQPQQNTVAPTDDLALGMPSFQFVELQSLPQRYGTQRGRRKETTPKSISPYPSRRPEHGFHDKKARSDRSRGPLQKQETKSLFSSFWNWLKNLFGSSSS